MLIPDPTIDERVLGVLVATEFDQPNVALSFVPIGGDSWNYRAGPWWVSVRRDRQGHFPAAYEAACELREAGHAFVLAPARGRSGQVVFRVSGRPVVVSRFVDGITDFPTGLGKREKEKLASAASELHQATVTAPVPRETFELFFAEELDHALAAIASRTDSGPLGNDAARLVQRNEQRIAEWRAEIGDLQMSCRAAHGDFVLTHGEPDQPNVMVTRERDLLLLDWGDLLWAPSERDARGLANAGIAAPGRPRVKRFYELRWILGEIAEYLARLSAPHTGDAEDHRARRELDRYLV